MKTKVPAKLAEMTDLAAIQAVEDALIAEFDEQHDGPKDLTVMKEIAEATKAVRERKRAVEAEVAETTAEMDALRNEVHGSDADAEDGDDGDADDSGDDGDD